MTFSFRPSLAAVFPIALILPGHGQEVDDGANGRFNRDTWNDPANWNTGNGPVPTGATDVVIASGLRPSINNGGTPAFDGDLTLEANAILELGINSTADELDNVLGTGDIFLNSGSRLILRTPVGNTESRENIVLLGNAELAIGTSTSSHGRNRIWTGVISGDHALGIRTTNRQTLFLDASNTFTGGLYIGDNDGVGFGDNLSENNRAALVARAASALGTGLVRIGNGINLRIEADDVMGPNQDLILDGISSDQQGSRKLWLQNDLTVGTATVNGTPLAAGTYDQGSGLTTTNSNGDTVDLIGGAGSLIVTGGGVIVSAPVITGISLAEGAVTLTMNVDPANVDVLKADTLEGPYAVVPSTVSGADAVTIDAANVDGNGDGTEYYRIEGR